MTVVTSGFPELSRAFGRINKEFTKDLRKQLKAAAEPVRADASRLAGLQIRNLGEGDPWTGMRTGGGIKIVYVAPKQRGRASKYNPKRRRPNLAPHLLKAMEEGLRRNAIQVAQRADRAVADMERKWGS
jgi:hypothetical protein